MKEQKRINKIKIIFYIVFVLIILIDQIAKLLIIQKNVIVIPNFLNLTYTQNTGVAFGILPNNLILIISANIVVLGLIIKFLRENKETMNYPVIISLMLILSGGVSNLIDRIFRGYVIDFIDINLFNFPVFNIADIFVTIGVLIFIVIIIKQLFFSNNKERI